LFLRPQHVPGGDPQCDSHHLTLVFLTEKSAMTASFDALCSKYKFNLTIYTTANGVLGEVKF